MSKRIPSILTSAILVSLCTAPVSAQEKIHKIGYIADLSGPMQDNYSPIYEAFDFYVKELNARGGIDGVRVQLFVRDDGLDATRAASAALELISSEGVNSLWGMSQTRTHLAVYQVAARNRVPAIAMFSGIKEVMAPKPLPYAYTVGHVFEVAGEVSGKIVSQMSGGKGKVICNSIEAPGGVAACNYAEKAARAGGLESGTVLFPPTLTEFGAIAQRMMSMNPTIVAAHAPAGQNVGLIRALRGAGFDGPVLLGAHGLNEAPLIAALQGVGGLGKVQILSRLASPDGDGQELSDLRAAAAKYGKKTPLSTTSVMGWALGRVMEASLRKCGYPCSGEQLNAVLEQISIDMGSLMGAAIKFSATDHTGPTFWRVYQFDEASKTFKPASPWVEAASILTDAK